MMHGIIEQGVKDEREHEQDSQPCMMQREKRKQNKKRGNGHYRHNSVFHSKPTILENKKAI
jgi:hypothetical protein